MKSTKIKFLNQPNQPNLILPLLRRSSSSSRGLLLHSTIDENRSFLLKGAMSTSACTVICFDYGGFYLKEGDNITWKSGEEEIHTLVMRKCLEDVTYVGLVDRICRKVSIDAANSQLKLSYYPLVLNTKKPAYIWNDEDVFGYLLQVSKDQCRSVLHVEVIKGVDGSNGSVHVSRKDDVDPINEEMYSTGRDDFEMVDNEMQDNDMQENETDRGGRYEYVYDDNEAMPSQGNSQVKEGWEDGLDLYKGQEFREREDLLAILARGAHQSGFEYEHKKCDRGRFVAICKGAEDGCKWYLRASVHKNSPIFTIVTYNKTHTCSRVTTSTIREKRKGTPHLVASVLAKDYPGRFDTPNPKRVIAMVQKELGVKVSYSTALRGKNKAGNEVRGSSEESYRLLYSYLYMLEQVNPGTVTCVELDEIKRFKYLFFALGACIEGFLSMRKVIIIDGTHLKHVFRGVLIVASAQDPNHHHYPIAFGVVDGEKDASWTWFLNQLKSVIPDVPGMVFISDRNPSLIKSIREVFPQSQHGYCVRHLSQNVKGHVSKNKAACAGKFTACARAYTEIEFVSLYNAFKMKYPAAVEYVEKSVEQEKWARCYFPGKRYNIDTSNTVESINGVFKEARKYSLLPMIDVIIAKLAEWWNTHRQDAAKVPLSQKLVPLVENELDKRCAIGKTLMLQELNSFRHEYNVIGLDGKNYLVDMTTKTCSCKYFDIDRYPCVHGVAAAIHMSRGTGLHLSQFCSKYYLVEQWALAYSRTIYPVPHMSEWVVPEEIRKIVVHPPEYEPKKGKPQQKRYPSAGEHRGRGRGRRGRGRRGGGWEEYFNCSAGIDSSEE